jgi:hypothetical protein
VPAIATRAAALAHIASLDSEGVSELVNALQVRHDEIHGQREARNSERIGVGVAVVIYEVEQEVLTGLSGEVEQVGDDGYVDVRLDLHSTGRLRFSRDPDYPLGSEMRYLLAEVPAKCCFEPGTIPATCCFEPGEVAQGA